MLYKKIIIQSINKHLLIGPDAYPLESIKLHIAWFVTFRHLKKGIQEFHRKFVLAPADKAANNVVVV